MACRSGSIATTTFLIVILVSNCFRSSVGWWLMSDWITQLREALDAEPEWFFGSEERAQQKRILLDAARLLASGRRAKWCEAHESTADHAQAGEYCDYSIENTYCVTPCRIRDVLIVDIPEEAE